MDGSLEHTGCMRYWRGVLKRQPSLVTSSGCQQERLTITDEIASSWADGHDLHMDRSRATIITTV